MRRGDRAILLALLCVGLLAALPAAAGNVYRCVSGDGTTAYTSKRIAGAKCKRVSSYKATSKPQPRPVSKPEPTPASSPQVAEHKAAAPASASKQEAPKAVPVARSSNAPRVVRGQVYSFVGKDGVRNYTSTRPRGVAASAVRTIRYSYIETCYACSARPGVDFRTVRLNTAAFEQEIRQAAKDYGVEEAVVRAIIHAESAFNPNAISRAGAQGLMQLMPATARRFGVSDAFNAGQNIRGGVEYLAWLLKRFGGNLSLAAAGYNAGEGAVDKYDGVPPYQETQRYVTRVGQLVERYRSALSKGV